MDAIISIALRVVLPLLVVAGMCTWSYFEGVSRESDRRDAAALKVQEKADKDYEAAAEAARTHAVASIEWKRNADNYYRKWQGKLNDVNDRELSECNEPSKDLPSAAACMLSDGWVKLYNDAWHPDGMPADPGGADGVSGGSGTVTPREALTNISTNAGLCADDRQRQRKLIDYLQELRTIHVEQIKGE